MSNLNLKQKKENTYDAIVIGSGISGGWAAKEFCEKGLKTLVLERGRMVKHVEDYPTAMKDPWDFESRGAISPEHAAKKPKQMRTGFLSENDQHWFINDIENPYHETKRFDWIRGDHVGGRSIMWGRQVYRWSDIDFEANAKDGIAIDWPIRYKDLAPWYDYTEKFVGVSGQKLGLPQLPDGQFLKPMELNCLEKHAQEQIEKKFPKRNLTIGRVAHVTEPINGRGTCQFRNRCSRGCPFGAYFSSVAVSLPAAAKTGNYTLRPNSIVASIIYDDDQGKAIGVRVIDRLTSDTVEYYAKVISLNAGTVGSTAILLNSKSKRFENGLGNDSGELGHNMMDHHYFVGASGHFDGMEDQYYEGRRPNGIYVPRYRNISKDTKSQDYLRGYGYQGGAERLGWSEGANQKQIGADFKDNLFKPQGWSMMLNGFGECLPYHENKMTLHPTLKDKWGIPQVSFDAEFKENEINMRKQMQADAIEMLETAGVKDLVIFDQIGGIGKGIHEMGTARMGKDPKTSVLNKFNQVHAVKNVLVSDGACMTSSACVNPSMTYMALTARAVDHAVKELNKQNL